VEAKDVLIVFSGDVFNSKRGVSFDSFGKVSEVGTFAAIEVDFIECVKLNLVLVNCVRFKGTGNNQRVSDVI